MKSSADSEKMLLYDPPHMKICNTYETIGKYSNLIKGRDAATITFTFFHTKKRQEKCKKTCSKQSAHSPFAINKQCILCMKGELV